MLVGVALAAFVGKLIGAICGIAGVVIIVWAQFQKPKIPKQQSGLPEKFPVSASRC